MYFIPAAIRSSGYSGFYFRDSVVVVCVEPNGCTARVHHPGEDRTVDLFPGWFLFAGLSLLRCEAVVVLVTVAVCSGSGFCVRGSVFLFLSFLVFLCVCVSSIVAAVVVVPWPDMYDARFELSCAARLFAGWGSCRGSVRLVRRS